MSSNLVQYAVGLAIMLPLAGLADSMVVIWTWDLVWSLSYLVIGNSLISVTLLLAMIRYGEAAQVSALFFMVPPLAALSAWLLIGELLPGLAWVGHGGGGDRCRHRRASRSAPAAVVNGLSFRSWRV